eukprot:gene24374-30714_t
MIPINGERNEDISTGGSTTGTALSSILYSAGSLLRKSPFHEFGDSLISVLSEAMNSERFTMNHLMESPIHTTNHTTEHHHQETLLDFAESNDDHSSKSNPPPSVILQDVSRYYPPPLQPLESLVDVGYVRDLQAARAQGMVLRLLEQGEQLDREVRAAEAKCARLMSLLKPTYTRSNVGIPSAPVAKSLSSFPLTLTRRSLMEPTNYDSKLVLLRARRELKAQLSRGLSLQREMGLLVGLVLTQLDEWGADEYSARLLRKTAAVKDRLQVVHHFEMQLLITLHERFRARAAGVSGVGLASNRMFVDSDSSMQTFVQEKFPFLGDQEPVLLECAGALLNARKGTAYITVGHVLFYSMGILLSTVMTVLPLHTVALMTVISASKTVFSATYQQSGGASEAVSTSGVMTELTDCIVLVDVSGQETVLELRGVTPDHPRRVADLIDLLIQEKLYLLRTATDRRVSVTSSVSSSTSSSSFSMESDDHLLHLIDSVPVEPSAVTISSTQSAAVAHPHKEYLVPLVASVSPGLSTADSPSPSHSTQTEVAVMVSDSSKDVKKPIGKTSNLKLSVEQVAAALLSSSPNATSKNIFSGGSDRHHRTPSFGAMDGSLRQLNSHQLQHSPYYRALFGSPDLVRTMSSAGSFHSVTPQPQQQSETPLHKSRDGDMSVTSDEESEFSGQAIRIRRRADSVDIHSTNFAASTGTTADGSSEEEPPSSSQQSDTITDDFALKAMNLFGADETGDEAKDIGPTGERKAATAWNQELFATSANEDLWPALPQKAQRQVSRGISFAPTPLLRSPGRLGSSGRKSGHISATKLHTGRSDKYLNKLLTMGSNGGSSAKKSVLLRPRDSTPSPSNVLGSSSSETAAVTAPPLLSTIVSPRKLRFPEPGSSSSPSSSYKSMPSPLFASTAMEDSPGGGGFKTGQGVSFSPIHMTPFSSLTPNRHKIMSAYGGNTNGNKELSSDSLHLLAPLPDTPSSAGSSSAATSFKQTLTPGVLSSPSPALNTHHHHISFARYLAMTAGTATPSAVSRSTTADELQLLAEEDASSLLVQSCYSELDPQRVVRVLHEAVLVPKSSKGSFGQSPGGGFGLMGHSMRSLSAGLNLSSLAGGGGETTPRRPARRWDDPDSESDEEEEALEGSQSSDLGVLFEGPMARRFFRSGHNHGGDGGFANHSGYLQSILARCSYFRTMTTERPQPVDAKWFHSQVYPAYYAPRAGRELLLERLTAEKVLSGYISSGLFYHLVSSLCFEDDRVASSRMAVLKALFLQAPSLASSRGGVISAFSDDPSDYDHSPTESMRPTLGIRRDILCAMEHSSHSRLARCLESCELSLRHEVDANHIAKRGYLGCGDDSPLSRDAVLAGCSMGAVTGRADERPAYKTRDSDAPLLEMVKFVVACEIKEAAAQVKERQQETSRQQGDSSSDAKRTQVVQEGFLLRIAVNVFVNMFRCYGFKLGNSSELVEQPDLLNSLVEALEGLLLWAHSLSVAFHCSDRQREPVSRTAGNEPLFNTVVRFLLRSIHRHWTDRCNFGQDMAFVRVSEILLAAYTPLSQKVASSSSRRGEALQSLTELTASSAETIARKCLHKVCRRLGSHHFKVAMQALSCLQNASILRKYILPTCRPVDRYLSFNPVASTFRELVEKETAPSLPALNGTFCVGFTSELRETVLNVLVEALRANRTHWHPAVQQACSSALDALLDRLQELEDEADERADRGEEIQDVDLEDENEDDEGEGEQWQQVQSCDDYDPLSGEEGEGADFYEDGLDGEDEQGNYL